MTKEFRRVILRLFTILGTSPHSGVDSDRLKHGRSSFICCGNVSSGRLDTEELRRPSC